MGTKFFNVRVSYRGEGTFTFVVRGIGEVQIRNGMDLYIVDADIQTIEGLRQLKPAMVDIKIGAKSDGCYKTYDMNKIRPKVEQVSRMNYDFRGTPYSTVSNEDLSNIKKAGQSGPIPLEEAFVENTQIDNTSDTVDYGDYVLTSTSHKGKKLKKLNKRQLGGIKKYANEEDLEAIEKFLN